MLILDTNVKNFIFKNPQLKYCYYFQKVNFVTIKPLNMRLVIDFDEKYKDLFYHLIKTAKATIVKEEPEFWMDYPEHVRAGIEKSLEQVKNGQTKSYEEVKKMLANRKSIPQ
jgi:hypothetical protein